MIYFEESISALKSVWVRLPPRQDWLTLLLESMSMLIAVLFV